MGIRFFGSCDRQGKNENGKIGSVLPSWYHQTRIEELIESVERGRRKLNSGTIEGVPNLAEFKSELARKEETLFSILNSKPRVSSKEKDFLAKSYEELGAQIKNAMPSSHDMAKGFANAHDEVKKMHQQFLDVQDRGQLFQSLGIEFKNGKVSRNEAARLYKIVGKFLGENTNIERLRREGDHPAYRTEVPLDEML